MMQAVLEMARTPGPADPACRTNPFAPSDEQAMIGDVLRRCLREHQQDADLGRGPLSRELWAEISSLGIGMALLPERAGGFGGSPRDVALVAEEFGRTLTISPLAEGLVAATGLIARHGEGGAAQRWIEPVLAGETLLSWAPGAIDIAADGTVSGRLPAVRWAARDRALVVPTPEAAFIVDGDQTTVDFHHGVLIDGTPLATITLRGAKAERIGLPAGAVAETVSLAQLGYVAEMVGAMALLHRHTADFVQQRRQFGAAIGSFQVVQHKLARMFVLLEQSRSLLLKAACHDATDPAFARAVTSAKAYVAGAAQRTAEEAVQLHGGIGITDELVVGRGLRRVTVLARLFGNAEEARAQLAR